MKKYIKIGVVIGAIIWFYTSGNLQKVIDYFALDDPSLTSSSSVIASDRSEKAALLTLIAEQSRLADAISAARKNHDRDQMKQLFAEFEEVESRFQDEFGTATPNLTPIEGDEISRAHRDVMRKLN